VTRKARLPFIITNNFDLPALTVFWGYFFSYSLSCSLFTAPSRFSLFNTNRKNRIQKQDKAKQNTLHYHIGGKIIIKQTEEDREVCPIVWIPRNQNT
jgi:hypothetical protein